MHCTAITTAATGVGPRILPGLQRPGRDYSETLDVELDLAKLAFPRKNDDRLISLSVGIKTASKEDIAQHELRKYKGSRMASFRVHNHLASMKNSTMAYRTWKGSRAALTKKERLTEKYIRTLNLQWRVKRVEEFLSAASLDGLAPV